MSRSPSRMSSRQLRLVFAASLVGLGASGPAFAVVSPIDGPAPPPRVSPVPPPRVSHVESRGELLARLDRLFERDRDRAEVPLAIRTGLEGGIARHGESYDFQWRLARVSWWLSDGARDQASIAARAAEGRRWGERAIASRPGGVEGSFWTAANIGQYALGVGVARALWEGLEKKFNAAIDRAIAIDPAYEHAGPLRAKAVYFLSLPWPKRDVRRAIALLERALQVDRRGVRSRYYLALAYEKNGAKAAARQQVQLVLATKASEADPGDLPRVQALARQVLPRLR